MKNLLLFCLAAVLLTACNQEPEKISFKKMGTFDLGNLSKENANLRATAVFANNSEEEFSFKNMLLDLSIDGKSAGTIVVKMDKKIKANAEFSIPIKYNYPTSTFVIEGHEPSGTYAVSVTGEMTVTKSDGNTFTVPVEFSTNYEYLTKKEERVEKRETRKEEREKKREERREKRND
ncbi:MAG TPA: hypothetical protein PLA16_04920 [Chitinophagales bacterium]|jgi:hypothetical protein|nr:hypothetical protein [Chitinophagales bacterium]HPA35685.1 hypothetical protein [Chitinophagales bacterium]HQD13105.1 hypothetical protein [Chitinophagales bacterium]HQO31106.1 hypothetical protein [Chitinophagales bacterium]HQO89344.1 hypothetical protein [Chitinophagales bacterium]